jgi:integrase
MTGHRNKPRLYPGAKRNPYVFVSELGRPIAANTVESIFIALRQVEGIPDWLTAHKLRHTFNDRLSEMMDGLPEDLLRPAVEARMRNFLNGWSPTSDQGEHYRKRFVQTKAHEFLLKLQNLSAQGAARS